MFQFQMKMRVSLLTVLRYYSHAFDMDESKIDLHDSYICFAKNWVLLLCLIFNNMHCSVVFERILIHSFMLVKSTSIW